MPSDGTYLRFAVAGGGTVQIAPGITVAGPQQWSTDWYTGASGYTLEVISTSPAFTGWSGDCSGTKLTCTLDMATNRTVTAHFADGASPDAGPITSGPGLQPAPANSDPSSGGSAPGPGPATPVPERKVTPPPFGDVIVSHNYVPDAGVFQVGVTGTVPVGTGRVTRVRVGAVSMGSPSSPGAHEATRPAAKSATCRVTRRVRGSARAFRCGLRLAPGAWNVTTAALSGRRVVARSIRTVVFAR